ncbi:hypothetical protein KC340_g16289 [Hortaea werneckii]|nr:hypothetical protein KC339_g13594 [Hortaea werneckii]KAI7211235.1 hypothetical protein KC365_g15029 [Hortaea werneckii]KAI7294070.1 hypothetical protein KC340_g16289 [Hortaea werneckii]KAI7379661.1 hypothetical protein KC328_g13198 [Hortaea werneckii]KAI7458226.1 hypothetical protein KC351_g18253 [Hortaea werneckii]
MEALFQKSLGQTIESFVDDAASRLASLQLPTWYITTEMRLLIGNSTSYNQIASKSPLRVASGLEVVLSSPDPPSVAFFKALPKSSKIFKTWAVYALVLERPNSRPRLYIGSGTNGVGSASSRMSNYEQEVLLPAKVKQALAEGFIIKSKGMLCWTALPKPESAPRLRRRLLALEAVFTVVFCACVPTPMDFFFIPDFFLWNRDAVEWDPLCTHLPLSEKPKGDITLSEDELRLGEELRKKLRAESQARSRQRQRDADEAAYLQRNHDQHAKWAAENRPSINKRAGETRKRAKDSQRFRCHVCEYNAATQVAYNDHLRSESHKANAEAGRKLTTPLTDAGVRMKARRARGKTAKEFQCVPCDKAFGTAYDLKRHNSKDTCKRKTREFNERHAGQAGAATA